MTLGEKIAGLRRTRGWTQTLFAEKIGVHSNHISRLETNRMRPATKTLKRIAELFNVPVDELLDAQQGTMPEPQPQDQELFDRFCQVKELAPEDQALVFRIIETFATQRRVADMLAVSRQAS